MGGKSKAPAPDPQLGAASLEQIALNKRQYDDYIAPGGERDQTKAATKEALDILRQSSGDAREISQYQLDQSRQNDARYRDVTLPYEDEIIADSRRFDGQAYKDEQVARATADVNQAFDGAQQASMRALARQGVNPNSGAYAGNVAQTNIAKATAIAGAANKTRLATDQVGLATKLQTYGGLKGVAGLGATNAGLATQAIGTSANAGQGLATTSTVPQILGNQTLGVYNNGVSSGINSGLGVTQSQQNASRINNDNTIFGGIAALGQAGAKIYGLSDENMKSDIKKTSTAKMLKAVEDVPVKDWKYDAAKGGPDDGGQMHTGPMAQDVKAKMGGKAAPGGKMIDLVTMNGIIMGAVQELAKKVKKLEGATA